MRGEFMRQDFLFHLKDTLTLLGGPARFTDLLANTTLIDDRDVALLREYNAGLGAELRSRLVDHAVTALTDPPEERRTKGPAPGTEPDSEGETMHFKLTAVGELSVRHIETADGGRLNEIAEEGRDAGVDDAIEVNVSEFADGWFVAVGSDDAVTDGESVTVSHAIVRRFFRRKKLSETFLKLVKAAQDDGLSHLRIHNNGPVYERLETFS